MEKLLLGLALSVLFATQALAQVGAWPGTVILDQNNTIVGNLNGGDVTHQLHNQSFVSLGQFAVGKRGFFPDQARAASTDGSPPGYFYFLSTDCSGTAYMSAEDLPVHAVISDLSGNSAPGPLSSVLVSHPLSAYQVRTFSSVYINVQDFGDPGCYPITEVTNPTLNSGVVATEVLTVVPPLQFNLN